jgi:hypothetical protein
MMLLALLALPTTASAQGWPNLEAFAAMPADRIADAILPEGHPPIARVQLGPYAGPFVPTMIDFAIFYTAATPVGADFCAQQRIDSRITPIPNDSKAPLPVAPRQIAELQRVPQYRYRIAGQRCDGTEQYFAIAGLPAEQAMAAVRALDRAMRAVDRKRPGTKLAFRYDDGLPGPGYASYPLSLDAILSVEIPPAAFLNRSRAFDRAAMAPGRRLVEVKTGIIGGFDQVTARIVFAGERIERIAIERATIVY